MKAQVKKYLKQNYKYAGRKIGRRYHLKIGGLIVFFNTIKEAESYYQTYLKS